MEPTGMEIVNRGPMTTIETQAIPVDVFRFFGQDLSCDDADTINQMKVISEWAFNGEETTGDAMVKLRNLEMKLGTPQGNESRENKLYNWVQIQKNIIDLQKRQDALRG